MVLARVESHGSCWSIVVEVTDSLGPEEDDPTDDDEDFIEGGGASDSSNL